LVAQRTWSIREFDVRSDVPALQKLFSSAAGFDGSVPSRNETSWQAFIDLPQQRGCGAWRVAVAAGGAVVGALLVTFVGNKRTAIELVVNPAFRRQGIGTNLLAMAPRDRRLLVQSIDSVDGAAVLLEQHAFVERHRDSLCRRTLLHNVPEWMEHTGDEIRIIEDQRRDGLRAAALIKQATDDGQQDVPSLAAELEHGRARVLYVQRRGQDLGIAVVLPLWRARRADRDPVGEPLVAELVHVGLLAELRGRGWSRKLVRAATWAGADAGFEAIEVAVDQRQHAALTLYQREGFNVVDERVWWMRREPTD
jgi:GNAT superfamily N-acetyltransferase